MEEDITIIIEVTGFKLKTHNIVILFNTLIVEMVNHQDNDVVLSDGIVTKKITIEEFHNVTKHFAPDKVVFRCYLSPENYETIIEEQFIPYIEKNTEL